MQKSSVFFITMLYNDGIELFFQETVVTGGKNTLDTYKKDSRSAWFLLLFSC
jgi:hypothetical protein